jgi:hypothetical protein
VIPISAVAKEIIDGDIAATKPPVELMPQQISTIWHKRQDRDQGLNWLREHFKRIIGQNVDLETAKFWTVYVKKIQRCANKVSFLVSVTPP